MLFLGIFLTQLGGQGREVGRGSSKSQASGSGGKGRGGQGSQAHQALGAS